MVTQEKTNLLQEVKRLKDETEDLKMSLEKHTQVTVFLLKQRTWYKSKIALLNHAVEELESSYKQEQTRADMLAKELSKVCYENCDYGTHNFFIYECHLYWTQCFITTKLRVILASWWHLILIVGRFDHLTGLTKYSLLAAPRPGSPVSPAEHFGEASEWGWGADTVVFPTAAAAHITAVWSNLWSHISYCSSRQGDMVRVRPCNMWTL